MSAKLFKKIISSLVTIIFLLSPVSPLLAANTLGGLGGAGVSSGVTPLLPDGVPFDDSSGNFSTYYQDSPGSSFSGNNLSGGQDQLSQQRQQDSQSCQSQKNASNGIQQQAGSLQSVLNQGFSQRMGQMFQNLFANKLPGLIQRQLEQRLPQIIQGRLSQQLPGFLDAKIRAEVSRGQTATQIRSSLSSLLPQWISELMDQVVRQSVPDTLQEGLQRDLPSELVTELQDQVPDIIASSTIPTDIDSIVASTTTATPEVTKAISDAQRTQISDQATAGVIGEAQSGINHSQAIIDLSNQIIPQIISQLAPQLIQQLMPSLNSSLNSFSSGGGYSNLSNLSLENIFSGGAIGGVGGQFIGDLQLNQNFLNPLQTNLTKFAGDWGGTNALQILHGPENVLTPSQFNSLSDTVSTAPLASQAMQNVSGQTASQVAANSNGIANNAFSGSNLNNLTNGLKGSLASGLGSGIGGLVSGIPIVGGFIAPIVQEYVTQFANALLGVGGGSPTAISAAGITAAGLPTWTPTGGPGAAGIATAVSGTTLATQLGFLASNKNTGDIAAHTDLSNQNEKHLNETQDQACIYEQQSKGALYTLVDIETKYKPNAAKARLLALQQLRNEIQKYYQHSYQTSPGLQPGAVSGGVGANNNQGDNVVAQPLTDLKDRRTEILKTGLAEGQSNPNTNVQKAAQVVAQTAGAGPDFSAMDTQADAYLWLTGKIENQQDLEDKIYLAQLIANQGYRDTRECIEWTNDVFQAGDLAEALNPSNTNGLGSNINNPAGMQQKYCAKWGVLTPGSTNKTLDEKSILAMIDLLINSQGFQSDAANQSIGQSLIDVQNLKQANPQTQSANQDPCPGTNPCPKSGWNPNQIDTSAIESAISNTADNQLSRLLNGGFGGGGGSNGNVGGNGTGNLAGVAIGGIISALSNLPPPTISLSQTLTNISATEKETAVSWQTTGAIACFASNNWLSGNLADKQIAKNANDRVDLQGEIKLRYATTAQLSQEYDLVCFNISGGQDKQIITVTNAGQ